VNTQKSIQEVPQKVDIVNVVRTTKLWGQKESVVFQAAQDVVKKVNSLLMGSVSKYAQMISRIFIVIYVMNVLRMHHCIKMVLVENVQQDLFFLAKINLIIVFAPRISKNMVILVVALMMRLVYVKLILIMKNVDVQVMIVVRIPNLVPGAIIRVRAVMVLILG
jgi:hypothetical protein